MTREEIVARLKAKAKARLESATRQVDSDGGPKVPLIPPPKLTGIERMLAMTPPENLYDLQDWNES